MKTSSPSAVLRSGAFGLCLMAAVARPAFADPRTGATCSSDSKLLNEGPTQVLGDGAGTYWSLEAAGLQAAFGNDEAAKIAYLSGVFGQQFTTLAEARDYNLQTLGANFDKNGDGLVCVYELRGTRANFGDPYSQFTYFSISDDKVPKKSDEAMEFRSISGR